VFVSVTHIRVLTRSLDSSYRECWVRYTLLVGVLPDIHLAVFDLHYRMETRVYRLYASDPETAEPFQLDIEDFHHYSPQYIFFSFAN